MNKTEFAGVKIGTTSFGFRYLLQDARRAPPLLSLVKEARSMGLDCLQVCENARPLELSGAAWKDVVQCGLDVGLEIQVGCLTLSPEVFARYLDLSAAARGTTVRVVLENEGQGKPGRGEVLSFLDAVAPRLQAVGMKLAVENHFDIPCTTLAEAVQSYPASLVGFCMNTANSLRNFEAADYVLKLLGTRALQYHVKDYKVDGTNVGFSVSGAPLGTGDFDLPGFVGMVFDQYPASHFFIENWVPPSGDWDTDVMADRSWLDLSFSNLRRVLDEKLAAGPAT